MEVDVQTAFHMPKCCYDWLGNMQFFRGPRTKTEQKERAEKPVGGVNRPRKAKLQPKVHEKHRLPLSVGERRQSLKTTVLGEPHSRGWSASMADQVPDPPDTTSTVCRGGVALPGGSGDERGSGESARWTCASSV